MDEVRYRYYIDWLPISALPVKNSIIHHYGLSRRNVERYARSKSFVVAFFNRYSFVISFDYVLRRDGVYLFRLICTQKDVQDSDYLNASRDLSDIIKKLNGHQHEFHSYPHGVDSLGRIKSILCGFKSRCWIDTQNYDYVLHIDPIEVEDPFTSEYRESTKKAFTNIEEILNPDNEDKNLSQLLALKREDGGDLPSRACVLLRAIFEMKKQNCLDAYNRISTQRDTLIPFTVSLIVFLLAFIALNFGLGVGIKTSLALSFLIMLAAYTLVYTLIFSPTLEVLQRTIGFYTHANMFSKVVESIYGKCSLPTINIDTGGFADTIKGIEARYLIESNKIERKKYFLNISFATLAIMFAFMKASVEIERIGGMVVTEKGQDYHISEDFFRTYILVDGVDNKVNLDVASESVPNNKEVKAKK